MTNLTALELMFLKAIDNSEYGDNLEDAVWFWSVADSTTCDKKQLSGIVSSLVNKDLICTQDTGTDEHTVWFTDAGVDAYLTAVGISNKPKA
jgi:hypothetical protein